MHQDIERVLLSEEVLQQKVQELADIITADYTGKDLLLVGILKGSFVFLADLCRRIKLPCGIDFMAVSSYNSRTTSGRLQILKDLSRDITGKDLLIVEDILDSGNTLFALSQLLQTRNPASLRICTLLDKPDRRTRDIHADYFGFQIPDAFVVGYGLDYDERYRCLPYIGILKPEVYS